MDMGEWLGRDHFVCFLAQLGAASRRDLEDDTLFGPPNALATTSGWPNGPPRRRREEDPRSQARPPQRALGKVGQRDRPGQPRRKRRHGYLREAPISDPRPSKQARDLAKADTTPRGLPRTRKRILFPKQAPRSPLAPCPPDCPQLCHNSNIWVTPHPVQCSRAAQVACSQKEQVTPWTPSPSPVVRRTL